MPEPFGAYDVYERLGTGGMATVHRAQTPVRPRTPIALKRLLPQLTAVPELVQSFLDEARLARYLDHPNIARTYDFGRFRETYFIAMELVRGPTLSQLIARCRDLDREVPLPIAIAILVQLCDALDYAHALRDPQGLPLHIVHRDVTPSNVIVSTTGIVKLIDFGIAKAAVSSVRTQTGFIKGKFGYVAPECISAPARAKTDPRTDIFAIGIIAHELLTRRKLFQVDNDIETLRRVQLMDIAPPSTWNPSVPPSLDEVVMGALERDPEHRWQSAGELGAALAALLGGVLPPHDEVAEWAEHVVGRPRSSEASAISIEISLIEDAARPRIGERVVAARRGASAKLWSMVAVLGVIVAGLATYAVVS